MCHRDLSDGPAAADETPRRRPGRPTTACCPTSSRSSSRRPGPIRPFARSFRNNSINTSRHSPPRRSSTVGAGEWGRGGVGEGPLDRDQSSAPGPPRPPPDASPSPRQGKGQPFARGAEIGPARPTRHAPLRVRGALGWPRRATPRHAARHELLFEPLAFWTPAHSAHGPGRAGLRQGRRR